MHAHTQAMTSACFCCLPHIRLSTETVALDITILLRNHDRSYEMTGYNKGTR